MSLISAPATARLDPWCLVDIDGEQHLFGFAERHDLTGGKSWTRSSPVAELDAAAGKARTASGRVYELGARIAAEDIEDEEGWLAFEKLVGRAAREGYLTMRVEDGPIERYLTARKVARHLGVEPPPRAAVEVDAFLDRHAAAYMRQLGRMPIEH